MASRRYTAEQVDAAVQALSDSQRFEHAQEIVTHAAPSLQRVLAEALSQGGWFEAHESQLTQAAMHDDAAERLLAVRTLIEEETRLGMLVGVAIGLELAHELMNTRSDEGEEPRP